MGVIPRVQDCSLVLGSGFWDREDGVLYGKQYARGSLCSLGQRWKVVLYAVRMLKPTHWNQDSQLKSSYTQLPLALDKKFLTCVVESVPDRSVLLVTSYRHTHHWTM